MLTIRPRPGDALILLGETRGHLGQSALLADLFDREEGAPPPVNLEAEAAAGALMLRLARAGLVSAAHDLSDGGLALAVAEMALAAACGAAVEGEGLAWFFGEDQARYLVACAPDGVSAVLAAAGAVPARRIGAMGGDAVALGASRAPLAALRAAHAGGFARLMGEG